MVMATMPTPFGWEVRKLMRDRRIEDFGLSEESEAILLEHLRGKNADLPAGVVPEIADSLGVDWSNGAGNGAAEARELSTAACWYLFMDTAARDQRTNQLTTEGARRVTNTQTCAVSGCERPAADDSFSGCRQHRAEYDAQAEVEAWDLAWKILHPWVEAAGPIGSDELTKVMKKALREVEDNVNLAQDNLELAQAAARRSEKEESDTVAPTCRVGSATDAPCTRPATVRVNNEDEPDMCTVHALEVALQTTKGEIQHVLETEIGQLEERLESWVRGKADDVSPESEREDRSCA